MLNSLFFNNFDAKPCVVCITVINIAEPRTTVNPMSPRNCVYQSIARAINNQGTTTVCRLMWGIHTGLWFTASDAKTSQ